MWKSCTINLGTNTKRSRCHIRRLLCLVLYRMYHVKISLAAFWSTILAHIQVFLLGSHESSMNRRVCFFSSAGRSYIAEYTIAVCPIHDFCWPPLLSQTLSRLHELYSRASPPARLYHPYSPQLSDLFLIYIYIYIYIYFLRARVRWCDVMWSSFIKSVFSITFTRLPLIVIILCCCDLIEFIHFVLEGNISEGVLLYTKNSSFLIWWQSTTSITTKLKLYLHLNSLDLNTLSYLPFLNVSVQSLIFTPSTPLVLFSFFFFLLFFFFFLFWFLNVAALAWQIQNTNTHPLTHVY